MRKLFLLFLLILSAGCSEDPAEPVVTGEVVVMPGTPVVVDVEGASLHTADGTVSLTIPAGAFASNASITIDEIDPEIPGVAAWSRAVDLSTGGASFDETLTLSLALDPEAIPAGVPPSALRLYTLAEHGWDEVPGSTTSPEYVVSAEIEDFGSFSVQLVPNAFRREGELVMLRVGETLSYGGFFFEYRTENGDVFPIDHQVVRWESSVPAVLELEGVESSTGPDGRAGSPRLRGRAAGTGVLRATIDTVTASIDFAVEGVVDVTGTYHLESVGGNPLPALGTGELVHEMTIVLQDDGACTFSGRVQPAQEDPAGEVEDFAFATCRYAIFGTNLDLAVRDSEEAEEQSLTAELIGEQIILPILIQDDTDETDEGVMGDAIFVKE